MEQVITVFCSLFYSVGQEHYAGGYFSIDYSEVE